VALVFDNITFDTSFDDVGDPPESWVLYSTDDASVSTPAWIDATSKVRAFSVSRGRENELAEVDAGTGTITLNNRTRTFDPVSNPLIRPMNRWWIRVQLAGETQDIFKGYANSYDQTWPGKVDALAIVNCSDEYKVLALDAQPTTVPPRSSYADLIQSDNPLVYWSLDDDPVLLVQSPVTPIAEQPPALAASAAQPPPPPPAQSTFDFAAWQKLHWRNIPE
jgi:hypothetical protein